jgi:hypothetical protein
MTQLKPIKPQKAKVPKEGGPIEPIAPKPVFPNPLQVRTIELKSKLEQAQKH